MSRRVAFLTLLVTGCGAYNGDFLYVGPIEGVPAVLDIKGPDGNALVPVELDLGEMAAMRDRIAELDAITDRTPAEDAELAQLEDDLVAMREASRQVARDATIYAEIGPNSEPFPSGATFEFIGNGGDVCAFVDPEFIFWNQSVSQSAPDPQFRFPDNPYDDGDLDLRAGLSVYYRGTPGLRMGGFEVQYTDELGNGVAIDLVACMVGEPTDQNQEPHSGRAHVEYCTIRNTQPGVSYTVALEAFSLPRDDGRLSFGVLLANGPCDGAADSVVGLMAPVGAGNTGVNQECVIVGESLPPEGEGKLFYGYAEGRSWEGSEEFEQLFCEGGTGVLEYCRNEISELRAQGLTCDYTGQDGDPERHCFCGDRTKTPRPGAVR